MSKNISEEIQELALQNYRIAVPIFLCLCILGVMANAVVIVALISTKVRTPTVTIISSLTLSDMWTSCVVAASLVYNSYIPMYYPDIYFDPCLSLAMELFRTGGLITGTLHLLIISIHHYIGITKPYYRREYTIQTLFACLLAWIMPFLFLTILASSFSNQGFRNCWEPNNFYQTRVFRLSVSALIVLIFVIIIFCYVRMIYLLRQQRKKFQSRSASNKTKSDNRTVYTTVLICSSFFIGWAPATIQFAITCYHCSFIKVNTIQDYKLLFYFSCLQLTFMMGKTLMNPLIYSFRIPEVDRELVKLHKKISTLFSRITRRNSMSNSKCKTTLTIVQTNNNKPTSKLLSEAQANIRSL